MEKIELVCIVCPMGCRLTVEKQENKITRITGNSCKRGEKYAYEEVTSPVRTLTTTVKVKDCDMLSVKSDKPLPKNNIKKYMYLINKVYLTPPIKIGEIVIKNIDNTGVNIVSTKNIRKEGEL